MKLKNFLLLPFLLLSVTFCHAQDWTPGHFMKQALVNTLEKATYIEQNTHLGFADGTCILGAYLNEGEQVGWSAYLERGKEYAFVGGGDTDADDTDILIYDEDGNLVKEDTEPDSDPIIFFQPEWSGLYIIRLKLYSCDVSGSFLSMAIMEEYGNSVPEGILDYTVERIMNYCSEVNNISSVKFHKTDNQWCLFGTILDSGEQETITNMDLGYEDHIFIAAGDLNLNDADLILMDDYGNNLSSDVESDPLPVFQYATSGSQDYNLRIKNYASEGKSLIFSCVLTE